MHGMAIAGVVLILVAIVGMGLLGGWGMPGPDRWNSWMPHMGQGMPHMGWGRGTQAGAAPAPIAGARRMTVDVIDFGFRPAEIRVKSGQPVNLVLTNRGRIFHDLVIPALNYMADLQPGQQVTVGLAATTPGAYEFYCSVPGHREAGMAGRLIVEP